MAYSNINNTNWDKLIKHAQAFSYTGTYKTYTPFVSTSATHTNPTYIPLQGDAMPPSTNPSVIARNMRREMETNLKTKAVRGKLTKNSVNCSPNCTKNLHSTGVAGYRCVCLMPTTELRAAFLHDYERLMYMCHKPGMMEEDKRIVAHTLQLYRRELIRRGVIVQKL